MSEISHIAFPKRTDFTNVEWLTLWNFQANVHFQLKFSSICLVSPCEAHHARAVSGSLSVDSHLKTCETLPTEQHAKWESFNDAVSSIPVYPQGLSGGCILSVSERSIFRECGEKEHMLSLIWILILQNLWIPFSLLYYAISSISTSSTHHLVRVSISYCDTQLEPLPTIKAITINLVPSLRQFRSTASAWCKSMLFGRALFVSDFSLY